ncbi:MAG: DnaB-like helicase C-terminal domain-containing protein [Syntrophomonas sp.]
MKADIPRPDVINDRNIMKNVIKIFYSYSHKDEQLREALETNLAILKRQNMAIDWHDRKIIPGQTWASEIDAYLNESDIIILLISADFIASDYCYGKEMELALRKHESGNTAVLPIIIRPVDWMTGTPFAKLQALPKDGKPVTTWKNQDEAWLDITKGVRTAIEHILKTRADSNKPTTVGLKDLILEEFKRINSLYDNTLFISGSPTGFYALDQAIDGIHTNDILLIAGRPSTGKSDLTLNIAAYLAIETHIPVAFFSMRLSKEHLTRRLLASESMIPINRIVRGLFGDLDWPKLDRTAKKLAKTPVFFNFSPSFSDVELNNKIAMLKNEGGIGLVVIDGIEYLASAHKYASRNAEVAALIKDIKRMSIENQVTIILTGGMSREVEMRLNKRPTIRDLDEWDVLASDIANVVIILYRSEIYNSSEDNPEKGIVELIITKNDYGPKTTLRLAYLNKYCSFQNISSEENEI